MNRELPHPRSASRRKRTLFCAAALSFALLAALTPSQALGDELVDQRRQLNSKIQTSKTQISQYTKTVDSAVARYEDSKGKLASAEAHLVKTESQLRAAKNTEELRVVQLVSAEEALKSAIAEVDAAKAQVESEKRRINALVRDNMVNSTEMLEIALLLDDLKTGDINARTQFSSAIFKSRSVQLDKLHALQFRLEAAQNKAQQAQIRADNARKDAAAQVAKTRELRKLADQTRSRIADLVAQNTTLKAKAERLLASEEARLKQMEADGAALDKRIAQRLAKQREEAAKAEAARRARQAGKATKPAPRPPLTSSSGLFWPAHGSAGSPFGLRLHPILGYYRMHWGTDIGAACGSPLYAAYDGVIAERYYNSGYGNRLVLDIGRVNGTYLSVGYAHATRYIVKAGQRVQKGQIIGYVGSTGLSTGCHLHLEVWANGTKVNPMRWF